MKNALGCLSAVLLLAVVGAFALVVHGVNRDEAARVAALTPEQRAAEDAADAAVAEAARVKEAAETAAFERQTRIEEALGHCEAELERRAHDPGSLSYPPFGEGVRVEKSSPGGMVLHILVRGRNGFGGMRLFAVRCEVRGDAVVALREVRP